MSIAQGYVICICMTAAVVGCALVMLWMSIARRAELDDGATLMLRMIGVGLILALGDIWAFALAGVYGFIR